MVVVFAIGLHVILDIEPIIPAGRVVVTVTFGGSSGISCDRFRE